MILSNDSQIFLNAYLYLAKENAEFIPKEHLLTLTEKAIASKNVDVIQRAILLLSNIKTPETQLMILQQLKNSDDSVKVFVIYYLDAKIFSDDFVEELKKDSESLEEIGTDQYIKVLKAYWNIQKGKNKKLAELIAALSMHPNTTLSKQVIAWASEALQNRKTLYENYLSKEKSIQEKAEKELLSTNVQVEDIPYLEKILASSKEFNRLFAINQLLKLPFNKIKSAALSAAKNEKNTYNKLQIINTIIENSKKGDFEVQTFYFEQFLSATDADTQNILLSALKAISFTDKHLPLIQKLFSSDDASIRYYGIDLLFKLPFESIKSLAINLFKNEKSTYNKLQIIKAITGNAKKGDFEVQAFYFEQFLSEKSEAIKNALRSQIKAIKLSETDLPLIDKLLTANDSWDRLLGIETLERVSPSTLKTLLLEHLKSEKSEYNRTKVINVLKSKYLNDPEIQKLIP